jgi:DNA polymerase III epsilon subunit-like protein
MKEQAIKYYELGLNPTCISYIKTKYNSKEKNPEKSPCHSWKRWQVRRPSLSEVTDINWDVSNGIGAVLGNIHRCIDIDDCDDYDFIKILLKFLRLPQDYEWVIKTPKGFHIHIKSGPIFFATNKELIDGVLPINSNENYRNTFSKIELRWANHIVLPPTVINGKKYQFVNDKYPTSTPVYVGMFDVLRGVSKFCGTLKNTTAKFETQNMTFQLCAPSEGYPYAEAVFGNGNDDFLKQATNPVGYFDYDKVPKNKRAGYIEFHFGGNNSLAIGNWYQGSEFFIDIETTGLIKNPFDYDNYPRIIQIAYYDSYKRERKNIYIKPEGFTVPPEIEALTGLSNQFLNDNGISINDALNSINKLDSSPIIGHNVDFDLSVIDSEYLRIKKNPKVYVNNKLRNGAQVFCTMKKFSDVFNCKYPSLSELFNYFFDEIPSNKIHNAEYDVEILIDCYYVMCLYGFIKEDYDNQLIV